MKIDFAYPCSAEKLTPVSGAPCLVKYNCRYAATAFSLSRPPRVVFRIEVPCITTCPASRAEMPGGMFGQLSVLDLQTGSENDVYPEDLVAIVDRHSLSPRYSYLTEDDQEAIIQKIHFEERTSVQVTDNVRTDLTCFPGVTWHSVRCSNHGMLHSYSTMIGTQKSGWVPYGGNSDEI